MFKEFMLVFALILFLLATYYVIQFAHGKTPTYTGIVAIISLLGSMAYPAYYFSPLNSEHREQVVDTILPIGAIVERMNNVVDSGIDRTFGGVANATFAYGSTALVGTAAAPFVPAFAALLTGPLGWFLLPLLAFLMGVSRHHNRRILGGKRLKKTV